MTPEFINRHNNWTFSTFMDEIEIISIKHEMKQGKTAPYLCHADDESRYVVKGSKATYKGLIYEWVVANLAAEFGLPVPSFKKAIVDTSFTQYGLYELYGYNFASQFQDNIQDIRFDQLDKIEPNVLKDLFFFDYWIQNGDRCLTEKGGNPNFFLHQKTLEPFVLDHNLAFDEDFSLQRHQDIHVGAKFWNGLDLVDKPIYEAKIASCIHILDDTFESLPDEWLEIYPEGSIQASIKGILGRVDNEEFWEGIK